MKYLKQFSIILLISFIGEILNKIIPLPIPASIYGLVILFLCLQFNILKLYQVERVGRFLLEIMPAMFIPVGVGLMTSWDILKPVSIPFIAIIIVSSIITFGVSGKVTEFIVNKTKSLSRKDGKSNG